MARAGVTIARTGSARVVAVRLHRPLVRFRLRGLSERNFRHAPRPHRRFVLFTACQLSRFIVFAPGRVPPGRIVRVRLINDRYRPDVRLIIRRFDRARPSTCHVLERLSQH